MKVEEFLRKQRAEKEARKNALLAEQREKVANRIKAEKEDVSPLSLSSRLSLARSS